jgi:hypothetical protein
VEDGFEAVRASCAQSTCPELKADDGSAICRKAVVVAAVMGESTFAVPAVQGQILFEDMQEVQTQDEMSEVGNDFANEIAKSLGLASVSCTDLVSSDPKKIVNKSCGEVDCEVDFTNAAKKTSAPSGNSTNSSGGRRLDSHSGVSATYVVRKRSMAKASLAAKQFSTSNLLQALQKSSPTKFQSVSKIDTISVPQIISAPTFCPENKAKPPGAPFVSIKESCKCQAGYQMDGNKCVKCPQGRYKNYASNNFCVGCNSNGTQHTFTTGTGATGQEQCYCQAGYFRYPGGPCLECEVGFYCYEDDKDAKDDCSLGSRTLTTKSTSESDCNCLEGFGREVPGQPCVSCAEGKYKSAHKDEPCTACPKAADMNSALGSSKVQACYCKQNFYFKPSGIHGDCMDCKEDEGLICNGGFSNASDFNTHIMPIAKDGYYLTGNARSKLCIKNQETSLCKGGRDAKVPCMSHCNCLEGHDGFLCQNCQAGWTRDSYTDKCKVCSSSEKLYFELTLIWLNALASSVFYHVLTIMAIRAGQGTKSLHSVLIRLWQSWVLSMNVLKVFDFSKIKMFSWGVEAAQMKAQTAAAAGTSGTSANGSSANVSTASSTNVSTNGSAAASSADSGPNTLIPFPDWFSDVSKIVFSLDSISVDLGTPTTTIECMTELIMGKEAANDWKYIAQAIYHVSFPLFVLFWMLVLDLILVYLLYPGLERAGILGRPSDAKKMKVWMLDRVKPLLEEALEEEEVPEELRPRAIELFNCIMTDFTLDEGNLRILAQCPREGLLYMSDLIRGDGFNMMARELILLLSIPRFQREVDSVVMRGEDLGLPSTLTSAINRSELWKCKRIWSVALNSSAGMTVEEFVGILAHSRSFFPQLYRLDAGDNGASLQLSFVYPMFEATAKEGHRWSQELVDAVFNSLSEPMIEVVNSYDDGLSKIVEAIDGSSLRELSDYLGEQAPGRTSLLLVALHKDRIVTYLSDMVSSSNPLEGAHVAWGYVQKCCANLFVPPEVLKDVLAKDPGTMLNFIAESAGTGFGGCLALYLQRPAIMNHLEAVYAGNDTNNPGDAINEDPNEFWNKIVLYAYETPLEDLAPLLQEGSAATLIQEVTREMGARENVTEGAGLGLKSASAATTGAVVGAGALAGAGLIEGVGGVGSALEGGGGGFMVMGAFEAVKAMTMETALTRDYPVFGIFRAPHVIGLRGFLADARPLIYIALYTMWYPTTKRLLLLVHCGAEIEVVNGVSSQKSRWMQQSNYVCYQDTHLIITILAMGGLGVWSIGLLAYLGMSVKRHKKDLNKPEVQRRLAYFTIGYELDRAWWDILVKKSDNLMTIVITYTSIAEDLKAKLLCYAVLAGAYLIIHVLYQPFDDRKNMLGDRIELLGLSVRFCVFGLFEMLLIFQPDLWMASIVAGLTFLGGAYFLVTIALNIACEFFADLTKDPGEGAKIDEHIFDKLRSRLNQDQGQRCVDKLIRCLKKCLNCFTQCCIMPIKDLVFGYARWLSSAWQILEDDALCFMPAGNTTRRVQSRIGKTKGKGCLSRIGHSISVRFFHQQDDQQKDFCIAVLANCLQHFIGHLDAERVELGDGIMGQYMVICSAYKEALLMHHIPMGCSPVDKAEIVKAHIKSAVENAEMYVAFDEEDEQGMDLYDIEEDEIGDKGAGSKRLKEKAENEKKLRLTGEDMNDTLMMLQRCDTTLVKELLAEAKMQISKFGGLWNKEASLHSKSTQAFGPRSTKNTDFTPKATKSAAGWTPLRSNKTSLRGGTLALPRGSEKNPEPELLEEYALALQDDSSKSQNEKEKADSRQAWKLKAMSVMGVTNPSDQDSSIPSELRDENVRKSLLDVPNTGNGASVTSASPREQHV